LIIMTDIRIKRVYEPVNPQDGVRILVDRVWPRGMRKDQVQSDLWLKDVAPSAALRNWFNHDRAKWEEFTNRYYLELNTKPEIVARILDLAVVKECVTLLFSARDLDYNQAVVLRQYLLSELEKNAK